MVNRAVSLIVSSKSKSVRSTYQTRIGIQYLLQTPTEAIDRAQRENIMKRLVGQLLAKTNKTEPIGMAHWRPTLSLMVKVMEKPTFYDVSFAQNHANPATNKHRTWHLWTWSESANVYSRCTAGSRFLVLKWYWNRGTISGSLIACPP